MRTEGHPHPSPEEKDILADILRVGIELSGITNLDSIFYLLDKKLCELFFLDEVDFYLFDTDEETFVSLRKKKHVKLASRTFRLLNKVLEKGNLHVVNEKTNLSSWNLLREEDSALLRSALLVPEQRREGVIRGVYLLISNDVAEWSSKNLRMLEDLLRLVSMKISEFIIVERVQKSVKENETLMGVSRAISSQIELKPLVVMITEKIAESLDAERSSVFLVDENTNELWSYVAMGLEGQEIRFPRGVGFAGTVAVTGEILNLRDAYKDHRFNPEVDRKTKYRTKSILTVPMKNHLGEIIGVCQVLNKKSGEFFTKRDEDLLLSLASNASVAVENAYLYEEMKRQFNDMIAVLSSAVDARDRQTGGHSWRVARYSQAIALEMRLHKDLVETIWIAALLHDVGKIAVDDAVLRKAGNLTDDEWQIMRSHVVKSKEILLKIHFSRKYTGIPYMAGSHHEKLDGKGYPDGLKGSEIPLGGQILGIADAFDALTQKRYYKEGLSPQQALDILRKDATRGVVNGDAVEALDRFLMKRGYKIELAPADEVAHIPIRMPIKKETGPETPLKVVESKSE